jgi:hypothetical protein
LLGDGHCRSGDHAVQSPESGGGTLTALDVPIRNTPALTVAFPFAGGYAKTPILLTTFSPLLIGLSEPKRDLPTVSVFSDIPQLIVQ